MNSAISCIVIKSDRHNGKIPLSGETVRANGHKGFFIVMNVDRIRRMAQLMEKGGKHRLIDVPFDSIRAFNRNLSRVVQRFLDAKDEAEMHLLPEPDRT